MNHAPANTLLINIMRQEAAIRGLTLEGPMTPEQERELARVAARRTHLDEDRVLCVLEMQRVGNIAPT